MFGAELEPDEHSLREHVAPEPARELLADQDGVTAHDLAPHVALRVARAAADARGLRDRAERAARAEAHHGLLLVFDERRERIRAARLRERVHLRAVRHRAAQGLVHLLRGLREAVRVARLREGRHLQDHRRDAVALQEAAPLVLGHLVAEVQRKRRIVHGADALDVDHGLRVERGLPLAARIALDHERVVPPRAVRRAVELPARRTVEREAPVTHVRVAERVAAEEREAHVLDRGGEPHGAVQHFLELLLLRLGLRALHVGHHAPAERGERREAAVHAREERRVGLLDLGVDVLKAGVAAAPRRVIDALRRPQRETRERVRPLDPRLRARAARLRRARQHNDPRRLCLRLRHQPNLLLTISRTALTMPPAPRAPTITRGGGT